MRARRSLIVATALAVGAAIWLPLTAAAHALPQSAIPPEGAEIPRFAPIRDRSRSRSVSCTLERESRSIIPNECG